MDNILSKDRQSEEEVVFSAVNPQIQDRTKRGRSGTCFAGKGKVCSTSLIPNPKKADRLRTQNYW